MKKTLIYFAAAAGTILAASSCCGEMSYKEYGFTENAALKDGLDAALDISIMMEYPDGGLADETISKICNAITVTAFGEEYAGMSPQDAVNACAEKYIASYREINLELAGSEAGAGASALSWDKYTEGMFTGTYGKKMTGYKVTDYSYTGGAHGMNSETCLVFNMKTGDRVSLDDIFRDDSRDILTSLLTRHAKDGKTGNDTAVKDGNGTPAVQKAGSDDAETDNAGAGHVADYLLVTEVEPTENFTVDDEGVTFVYNPYEIAAYAAGTVRRSYNGRGAALSIAV